MSGESFKPNNAEQNTNEEEKPREEGSPLKHENPIKKETNYTELIEGSKRLRSRIENLTDKTNRTDSYVKTRAPYKSLALGRKIEESDSYRRYYHLIRATAEDARAYFKKLNVLEGSANEIVPNQELCDQLKQMSNGISRAKKELGEVWSDVIRTRKRILDNSSGRANEEEEFLRSLSSRIREVQEQTERVEYAIRMQVQEHELFESIK